MERLWIRVRVICLPPGRMSDRVGCGYSRGSLPNPGFPVSSVDGHRSRQGVDQLMATPSMWSARQRSAKTAGAGIPSEECG